MLYFLRLQEYRGQIFKLQVTNGEVDFAACQSFGVAYSVVGKVRHFGVT
jgi:hypothetical protein